MPEPPGGLVPYREGKRWGYCAALGRVWIKPVFPDEPSFLVQGIAPAPLQIGGRRVVAGP